MTGRRPGAWPLILCLGLVVVGTVPAEASILRLFRLEELQEAATLIVTAEVVDSRGLRAAGSIVTETALRVERTWKGPDRGTLRLRTLGGRAGALQLRVPGSPGFRAGERVVVFLYRDGETWRPVGMFQGVWRLEEGASRTARPSSPGGADLLALTPGPHAVTEGPRPVLELVGGGR